MYLNESIKFDCLFISKYHNLNTLHFLMDLALITHYYIILIQIKWCFLLNFIVDIPELK